MNLEKAQSVCEQINDCFKRNNLRSVAEFKGKNNQYEIVIKHYNNEVLPSFCDNLKKIVINPETYIKQGPRTPSNPGKWIDKPMSPANRNVDGPSALGGPRRIMDIQDLVRTFANKRSNMYKIKLIAKNIKRLASLERIPEVDRLVLELNTMLNSKVYEHIKEKSNFANLVSDFDNTYNLKNIQKMESILEKYEIKKVNKIRQILKEIVKLIETKG